MRCTNGGAKLSDSSICRASAATCWRCPTPLTCFSTPSYTPVTDRRFSLPSFLVRARFVSPGCRLHKNRFTRRRRENAMIFPYARSAMSSAPMANRHRCGGGYLCGVHSCMRACYIKRRAFCMIILGPQARSAVGSAHGVPTQLHGTPTCP